MWRPEALQTAAWAAHTLRRRAADFVARWIVRAGGLAAVGSIVLMLAFLSAEVAPLWRAARSALHARISVPSEPSILSVSTDEYQQFAQVVRADGTIEWLRLSDGQRLERQQLPGTESLGIARLAEPQPGQLVYWRTDGVLVAAKAGMRAEYGPEGRSLVPEVQELGRWPLLAPERLPRTFSASAFRDGTLSAVWVLPDGTLEWWAVQQVRALLGGVREVEKRVPVTRPSASAVVALVQDRQGTQFVIGDDEGGLELWDTRGQQPTLIDRRRIAAAGTAHATALAFLIGDRAFVVGDSAGGVAVWQPVRDEHAASGWRIERIHGFASHPAAVVAVAPSQRDKSFLTADIRGDVALRHSTSEQTLLEISLGTEAISRLAFAPKGNGLLGLSANGELQNWVVENPHPEVTLRTLFGKGWYEGYEQPEYVWQSTGGTDDFEPKLSLVPLVFGTVKGTVYALLFAVPIALLAAVYTSQFSPPGLRAWVKPTVEVMAALPSVVLGFVAGLVLAPAVETHIVGLLVALPLGPLSVAAAGMLWYLLPQAVRSRVPRGAEVGFASLLLSCVIYSLWNMSAGLERSLFGGDFRHWLSEAGLGRFDQRNCLVVGLAMGFAVIPVIFTIAEDALANVPQRLVSASLALGATRWQTALYVVLPAASPGIFSAVMIGFGRAVGETMIVLMATGNTPVLDWSIFTGMRTLSANIAVEIPEAPYGSTLYRVLFLAALLLFLMTFVVNTAAEIVRQRLRERYQRL